MDPERDESRSIYDTDLVADLSESVDEEEEEVYSEDDG